MFECTVTGSSLWKIETIFCKEEAKGITNNITVGRSTYSTEPVNKSRSS